LNELLGGWPEGQPPADLPVKICANLPTEAKCNPDDPGWDADYPADRLVWYGLEDDPANYTCNGQADVHTPRRKELTEIENIQKRHDFSPAA
jgi:hypothetical protein